jgi:site-specific recombinase XerD
VTSPATWDTIFAALAPSTQQSYRSIFSKFLVFMRSKNVNVNTVSLELLFEFLNPLVASHKAGSTIRAYVAALKYYLRLFQRSDLVDSPLLTLFSEGAQRKAPIPKRNNWIWDAGVPLKMIRDRAHPSEFLAAAREALFLLLMATGIRVDDVYKLGEDFRWENGIFVIPFLGKRKCKINGVWTAEQRLAPYPGNDRLCPINALLLYATFSVPIRVPTEKALFVSSTGQAASKGTLGRWVKDILHEAGIQAPAGSCRSASTSAAFARKLPIDVILSSAGWSSDLVFFRHYHRGIGKHVVSANLLPPL